MQRISGRLVTGRGQGAGFTQIGWAAEQFLERLGIEAYPGTLNLVVSDESLSVWNSLKSETGIAIVPPDSNSCSARAYPVRIQSGIPGAAILPGIADYPENKIEIIASLPLREHLSLSEGDKILIEISRPLAVRSVIFDVDGTLLDSLEAYCRVAELAAAVHGLTVDRDSVRQSLNTGIVFWEMMVEPGCPDRTSKIERIRETAMSHWPEVLRTHTRPYPGIEDTLRRLRRCGLRLGIATASRGSVLEPLREAGLSSYFAAVVTSKDVLRRKPAPDALLKCAEALEVRPDEAVYVGDTPLDVQASRAAGMAAVSVLSGAGDSALLSAEAPDWVIHSHARLPEILQL